VCRQEAEGRTCEPFLLLLLALFSDHLQVQQGHEDFSSAFIEFRREIFVMSSLSNDYCVRLYAICMDPFCLVTELIPGTDSLIYSVQWIVFLFMY
jgi:hypothetical protein